MFKKAYTYMFHDNKILQKFCTVLPFLIIAIVIAYHLESTKPGTVSYYLIFALSMFFGMFLNGYAINCIKSVIIQEKNENIVLPYLTHKSFITGFKFLITSFLCGLAVFAFALVLLLVLTIPIILFATPSLHAIVTGLFIAAFIVLAVLFTPALMLIFSHTEELTSFLRIPTAVKIIKKSSRYFLVFLLTIINSVIIGASYYFGISKGAVLVGKLVAIPLLILYFIGYVYVCYANAYLIGKLLTTEEFTAITAKKNPEENPAEISEES